VAPRLGERLSVVRITNVQSSREESVYIGLGTLVLILIIVLIIYFVRRA
jgi:hypothetical protein